MARTLSLSLSFSFSSHGYVTVRLSVWSVFVCATSLAHEKLLSVRVNGPRPSGSTGTIAFSKLVQCERTLSFSLSLSRARATRSESQKRKGTIHDHPGERLHDGRSFDVKTKIRRMISFLFLFFYDRFFFTNQRLFLGFEKLTIPEFENLESCELENWKTRGFGNFVEIVEDFKVWSLKGWEWQSLKIWEFVSLENRSLGNSNIWESSS